MVLFTRYSWWMGAMVALAILMAAAARAGALGPVQGVVLRVTSPAEQALNEIFRPVASVLGDLDELNNLRAENRELRVENERLRNDVTALQQDRERIAELEQALGIFEADTGVTRVAANIVTQGTAFTDVVSIDKGSNDGIRVGNPVISPQGSLVGTVVEVFGSSAFVRLITDTRSKVNARIAESDADGIVKGQPNGRLKFDLAQGDINIGDTVVTSGLGGGYPPDIPIGQVSEVSGTEQQPFLDVRIEPLVRLSTASLEAVLVNTSFVPRSPGEVE